MALNYYTLVHIVISLAGIASGFGAFGGLIAGQFFPRWTAFFLASTVATSVTGFFFPFREFTPAIAVGILSLLVLAVACYALYVKSLTSAWRIVFVINAVIALYLNFFVLIVQLFQKTPALVEIAPTQTESPFVITQACALAVFITLGLTAVRRFREGPGQAK